MAPKRLEEKTQADHPKDDFDTSATHMNVKWRTTLELTEELDVFCGPLDKVFVEYARGF